MRPPDFDRKPLYTDGVGIGWVGYGIFDEWPSACFQVFVWKDKDHPEFFTGENNEPHTTLRNPR